MERAATEQLMPRAGFARSLQLFQLGQKQTRVGNCVDSNVVAASVRRASGQGDGYPHEAAMGGADREPCGLRDDCSIGADPVGEQRAHAEALVLLVDDGGDEDLATGVGSRGFHGGGAHRRDATFHVCRAATIDAIAADMGAERLMDHSLNACLLYTSPSP